MKKSAILALQIDRQRAAGLRCEDSSALFCPLCLRETPIDSLTREHVVPSSVSGRPEVLTCLRCNNEQGSNLDSALRGWLDAKNAMNGQGNVDGSLRICEDSMRVEVTYHPDLNRVQMLGIRKASNPIEVAAIQNDLEARGDRKLHLNVRFGYNHRRFQLALVRSAYLAVYREIGCDYAFSPTFDPVRAALTMPSTRDFDPALFIAVADHVESPRNFSYLVINQQSEREPFVIVVIRLKTPGKHDERFHSVFFPYPGRSWEELEAYLSPLRKNRSNVRVKATLKIDS